MADLRDADRTRLLLQILEEQGGADHPVAAGELWQETLRRSPLTAHEAEVVPSGAGQRGRVNWNFRSDDLRKAGWLIKSDAGDGQWALSPEGSAALRRFTSAPELAAEARRLANEVNRELRVDRQRRLQNEVIPTDAAQRRVIEAARAFVRQGFELGESVFDPSRALWTRAVLDELRAVFPGPADVGSGTFDERLRLQLASVSDDAKLLMAEVVTLQLLPVSGGPGPAAKRSRIESVLHQMHAAPEVPDVVLQALTGGSFHPGTRMLTALAECIDLLLATIDAWLDLDGTRRMHLLETPLAWRDFVNGVPGPKGWSQRNSLMYLVHPGYFGPVVSHNHKPRIVATFAGLLTGPAEDVERALHDVVIALQVRDNKPIELYSEPYRSEWDADLSATDDTSDETPPTLLTDAAALASDLFYDEDWVREVLALLRRRRQIILTGPPGTGKTWAARKVAEYLAGGPDGVALVQFHPSYSYEDFFEGYRPDPRTAGSGFVLRPGPLRLIAEKARQDPHRTYVLVIDEINRGNLAKIFGELYFLLEYRDQGISLLYGRVDPRTEQPEPFHLPPNLLFIGTMNTADRSIALLDTAMRRRFAFVELHPDRVPVSTMFLHWAEDKPMGAVLAQLLPALNARIEDEDFRIGPSYLMVEEMNEARLTEIWKYEILPLLEEHHFGDGTVIAERYSLESLRKALSQDEVATAGDA